MLAVDNGNIEIYDRYSMKMTCLLVGQYSASPVKIDFNSNLIFVQYTCAFWRRRQSPSSWWNIYCRYLFSLVCFRQSCLFLLTDLKNPLQSTSLKKFRPEKLKHTKDEMQHIALVPFRSEFFQTFRKMFLLEEI